MPLKPVCNTMLMPVASASDVRAVFEAGLSFAKLSDNFSTGCKHRDLHDHLYYIGAVCPEFFAPLREELVRLDDKHIRAFACGLSQMIHLLGGTSDAGVDHLVRELKDNPSVIGSWIRRTMLAGIGSPAALAALGQLAGNLIEVKDLELMGYHVHGNGRPVEPRFAKARQAIAIERFEGGREALERFDHPIGLPVSMIMRDRMQKDVTWHYLTVDMSAIVDMPKLPCAKLHLVSPAIHWDWTLFCTVDSESKYRFHSLQTGSTDPDEELGEMAEAGYDDGHPGTWARAVLKPYDDQLTYCNGHTQMGGAVGDVGGPPIGLYPNPRCPVTGKLMFHVLTVSSGIREYGDGFRSLFVSEDAGLVACQATSWN